MGHFQGAFGSENEAKDLKRKDLKNQERLLKRRGKRTNSACCAYAFQRREKTRPMRSDPFGSENSNSQEAGEGEKIIQTADREGFAEGPSETTIDNERANSRSKMVLCGAGSKKRLWMWHSGGGEGEKRKKPG